MKNLPGLTGPAARIADLAPELAVERNPWPILTAAVGLSVGSRLLQSWRRAAERRPEESRSGLDAALLAGSSLARARAVAALRPARWIGGFVLAAALAAVNLAPALLFTPWMDGRTVAPAMLALADLRDDARLQAAALALVRDRRQPRRALCRAHRSGAAAGVGQRPAMNRRRDGARALRTPTAPPRWHAGRPGQAFQSSTMSFAACGTVHQPVDQRIVLRHGPRQQHRGEHDAVGERVARRVDETRDELRDRGDRAVNRRLRVGGAVAGRLHGRLHRVRDRLQGVRLGAPATWLSVMCGTSPSETRNLMGNAQRRAFSHVYNKMQNLRGQGK